MGVAVAVVCAAFSAARGRGGGGGGGKGEDPRPAAPAAAASDAPGPLRSLASYDNHRVRALARSLADRARALVPEVRSGDKATKPDVHQASPEAVPEDARQPVRLLASIANALATFDLGVALELDVLGRARPVAKAAVRGGLGPNAAPHCLEASSHASTAFRAVRLKAAQIARGQSPSPRHSEDRDKVSSPRGPLDRDGVVVPEPSPGARSVSSVPERAATVAAAVGRLHTQVGQLQEENTTLRNTIAHLASRVPPEDLLQLEQDLNVDLSITPARRARAELANIEVDRPEVFFSAAASPVWRSLAEQFDDAEEDDQVEETDSNNTDEEALDSDQENRDPAEAASGAPLEPAAPLKVETKLPADIPEPMTWPKRAEA